MSYVKAERVLPKALIIMIQDYVDGETLYIPKKEDKLPWGTNTCIKEELATRNQEIYDGYLAGSTIQALAETYYLSTKSIQRIILQMKKTAC